MKVSIIVPVYNGNQSIERTIQSVLNQSYQEFELIIIDDGSTDNTKLIVDRISKDNHKIRYFYQRNSGVSAARNKGISLSNGQFISFIDADDTYEETFIEKMITSIEANKADICYSGYKVVTPTAEVYKKKSTFTKSTVLKNYILEKTAPASMNWLISKKYIMDNDITFLEGISWGEDFEFFCEVLASGGKITYVAEYLSNYYVDFKSNHLSNYSIEKIDQDYDSIVRLLKNPKIAKDNGAIHALKNYRLPALIVYNLNTAISRDVPLDVIFNYYKKYHEVIKGVSYINNLRSFKLNLVKIKVKNTLKKVGNL